MLTILTVLAILIVLCNYVGQYINYIALRKDYKKMIQSHRECFHKVHKDKKK